MANVKDVAKRAEVSTATVSRVLTGRNKVNEETKQKVLAAMKELNYQPNYLGKQLRELRSNNILVVVPDFGNTFFYEVLQGIEIQALEHHYEILIKNMKNKEGENLDYFKYLHQKQVAGIIMLTVGEKEKLEIIGNDRVVIATSHLKGVDIPSIHVDNEKSAYKMTNYLLALNHRKIAFISGGFDTISSSNRLIGFQKALKEYGLEMNPQYIREGDYSFESGIREANNLLELDTPPTAIFAASDHMAAGVIKSIQRKGLRVPDDISVAGFDDIELASAVTPELTTISQPAFQIGEHAMDMMHQLITGKKIQNKRRIVEGKLIIRESCKIYKG
ncbi:LacI family DNA-binding transcriptional regulator [Oceanobacillus sp. CFH 90083]|uniref:LacI family DNA-binding transcriptional regulator n=1 Tax=Oceanobacillus sp. CFH 90083 TaxID=2592336 RepID=UPI0018843F1B|nr:LacI family DNA-binding transcriptional regulator [Oceanobacillus sp. CFH 90083]